MGSETYQRAAPAGTLYWLDELDATPEQLRKFVETGLWEESWNEPQRRAEGFNNALVAAWSKY